MNVSVTEAISIVEGVRAQITGAITATDSDFVVYFAAQGIRE